MQTAVHSFRYSVEFLRDQVAGVADARMCEQPGGFVNHPAWTVGHLTHTCEMIGGVLGVEPWLPEEYTRLFGAGSVPVAERAVYPSKSVLLAVLTGAEERVVAAVRGQSDHQLDAPFPDPAYSGVFPSVRHALTQVLVGHTAYHVGQVGAWRRAAGMPAMGRSYE